MPTPVRPRPIQSLADLSLDGHNPNRGTAAVGGRSPSR